MIIKKIIIENYLCYYGINTFEFAKGLNVILGENGEGKTKFFEAIDWLFNGENNDLEMLVSAKKLEEVDVDGNFQVRISMTVEQYGEKVIITRSFMVKKIKPNYCTVSSFKIDGIEETNSGERTNVDGENLLNRIFPFQIRKYSMFKGEAELNIFKNNDALLNLINLFSEGKHYDKYSEKGAFLKEKAEKAVEESSKLDKKNEVQYKNLEFEILTLEKEKNKYLVLLSSTEEEIRKIQENLQFAESHVSNADSIETLNKRIKDIELKISNLYSNIDENYTTSLFDENWILVNFESYHEAFIKKISNHSKNRRKLQSDFDRQKGIIEGEKKAKAELFNNSIPLPIGIPSKTHMEEMLNDEICKVCNREAKKGSEAYNFMMNRLQTYLESQIIDDEKLKNEEQLFKYDYTNRLVHMGVSHEDNLKNLRLIRKKIKDLFEFNNERKQDIIELKEKLEKEILERERILGNSALAEEKLIDVLKNYNAWQRDLKNRNQEHLDYNFKLQNIESQINKKIEEKDSIDIKSANLFLIKTREILRDIEIIFNDTKVRKFNEFLEKLQTKSNNFFKEINIDAFTGTIVFKKSNKFNSKNIDVQLHEDDRIFYKPNQSLSTSMYISILFAISELASEIKEENFPLIFDAPTSSFGENKTAQFLNLIYKTDNQKILLIKDFIQTDKKSNTLSIKKEFDNIKRDKAFWVKLERPFDPNNLKTLKTRVIPLKNEKSI